MSMIRDIVRFGCSVVVSEWLLLTVDDCSEPVLRARQGHEEVFHHYYGVGMAHSGAMARSGTLDPCVAEADRGALPASRSFAPRRGSAVQAEMRVDEQSCRVLRSAIRETGFRYWRASVAGGCHPVADG
jgi:hypothetical protein